MDPHTTDPGGRFRTALRLTARLGAALRVTAAPPHLDAIVVLNDARLPLAGAVLRSGRVVYSRDEPARVAWETRTRTLALDFELLAGPLRRRLIRATAEGRR